ncbi:MAG: four helix bundle protein [Meiothermus sp.]|uniref:four helix bundle protein n=1 Tax=Meiothermus sp. TaxID=1955249 RepID=UPI0025EBC7F3|nr:four helix bundle protein [Meiothermus sp.]MCS7069634.1 four helix bundle protein [Meiothermus sp.]MDW8425713.1 four helix bundle protein [Meiothermus sp.]
MGNIQRNARQLSGNGFFGFEQLEVYHRSVALSVRVFQLSEASHEKERFGLISQLRRAANSIALNIAEGKGRKRDEGFCRFLYQARGSLLETVCSLHLAVELGFLQQTAVQPLYDQASTLNGKLNALLKSLDPDFSRALT